MKMTTAAEIAVGTSGYQNDMSVDTSQQQHKLQQTCKVILVGASSAGLFLCIGTIGSQQKFYQATRGCATLFQPIVLEWDQPMEWWGKDIGAMTFCFLSFT